MSLYRAAVPHVCSRPAWWQRRTFMGWLGKWRTEEVQR